MKSWEQIFVARRSQSSLTGGGGEVRGCISPAVALRSDSPSEFMTEGICSEASEKVYIRHWRCRPA
jgi:hypothetical protein